MRLLLTLLALLLAAPTAQAATGAVTLTGKQLPVSGHRGQSMTATAQLTAGEPLDAAPLSYAHWSITTAGTHVADVQMRAVARHGSAASLTNNPLLNERRLLDRGHLGSGSYRLVELTDSPLSTGGRSVHTRALRLIVPVTHRRYLYVTFEVQNLTGDLDEQQAAMLDLARTATVTAQIDR